MLNFGLIAFDVKVRNYEIRIDQQNTFAEFYKPNGHIKRESIPCSTLPGICFIY